MLCAVWEAIAGIRSALFDSRLTIPETHREREGQRRRGADRT